jgi:hypothetical protein
MMVGHVDVPEVWMPVIDPGVHHTDSNLAGVGNPHPEPSDGSKPPLQIA